MNEATADLLKGIGIVAGAAIIVMTTTIAAWFTMTYLLDYWQMPTAGRLPVIFIGTLLILAVFRKLNRKPEAS